MLRITTISDQCVALIKEFENLELEAYLCPAGVWTIGWGTTIYPDGKRVRKGDRITEARAVECFKHDSALFAKAVDAITRDDVAQHEFDALVSFAYNEGPGNLRSSTLLRLVNAHVTDDVAIIRAFRMWNKARINGVFVSMAGLDRRRKAEAHLYLTGELNFFPNYF